PHPAPVDDATGTPARVCHRPGPPNTAHDHGARSTTATAVAPAAAPATRAAARTPRRPWVTTFPRARPSATMRTTPAADGASEVAKASSRPRARTGPRRVRRHGR